MRGEHDAELVLGDGLHQALQELAPVERVEAATGSSSSSSSGRLAIPSVSASCARWPPDSLRAFCAGSSPSRAIRSRRQRVVPAGVQPRAELQVVLDAEAAVGRRVLGDEADPGALLRRARGAARRAPRSCPRSAASRPAARFSSVLLPAPLGPTRPTTRPAGHLERAVRQRGLAPVALGQARRPASAALMLRPPARWHERWWRTAPRCSRRRARRAAPCSASARARSAAGRARRASRRRACA